MAISAHNRHWKFRGAIHGSLSSHTEVIATLLQHRQLTTPEDIDQFLSASYPTGLHHPLLMKGMGEAADRIIQAIRRQEPMAIYGDFDTDGITAVVLLRQALSAFGATVSPYIPHRGKEGYGLHQQAIKTLAGQGIRLLITVDCGISDVSEVAYANSLGLDVIIADHHTPPERLPEALAVINPKQPGCPYPYKQLVGVGIAFKLVQSLPKRGFHPRQPFQDRDMLDLVALGTVADVAPLDGENRILVREGLRVLNEQSRPGIRALCREAGIPPGGIDAMAIGYQLAPRLNAAGRMGDAHEAYELLSTNDEAHAHRLARNLEQVNLRRRQLTAQIQRDATQQAQREGKVNHAMVILASEHYPAGLVGLVAARLVEQWHRPVILIERGERESLGSARSIPGFNIMTALTTCTDLFLRHGGHTRAAGFTLRTEHVPILEERLLGYASRQLSTELPPPVLFIDTVLTLDQLNEQLLNALAWFEPCGEGNPHPVLMSEQVLATDISGVGDALQHLKFRAVQNGGRPIEAIAFDLGHLAEPLRKHPWIDIAYTPVISIWRGMPLLQLNIRDFRRAGKNHHGRG